MSYQQNADDGLAAMNKWLAEKNIQWRDLPDDPWKLPADCPIWKMGLSLAQAGWILASGRARNEIN